MICIIFYNSPELFVFRFLILLWNSFVYIFLVFDTSFLYSRICSRYSRCVSSGVFLIDNEFFIDAFSSQHFTIFVKPYMRAMSSIYFSFPVIMFLSFFIHACCFCWLYKYIFNFHIQLLDRVFRSDCHIIKNSVQFIL